jgi:iron complex outermembrane receptor protein
MKSGHALNFPQQRTLALLIGLQTLHFTPLQAQEAQTEVIDTIVVTGSRSIERSILESPVPVDSFSAQDVIAAGALGGELGEALATLVPSFNFLRQSNSGTSDHVRAGQLRGMSPDQMLVLVNGKRRHTSAVVNSETKIGRGTAAVDLNTIPLNAINHIEVLRDGAGAQYGSDAISGVINLILDRETVRPEFNIMLGAHVTDFDAIDRRITDGQTLTADGAVGFTLGNSGFLNVGFDLKQRNATNRSGFDQLPFFYPATPPNLAVQGQRNYIKGDPDVGDANIWFNGETTLGSAIAYAFGTVGRRDTEGATFFRYPDESRNVPSVYPDGYRPVSTGESRDHSLTLGLSNRLGDWSLDTSATLGGNRFAYGARESLNASYGASSPTTFDSGEYLLDQLTVNSDLSRLAPYDTAFGSVHLASGVEYRKERFRTRAGEDASWMAGPFDADIGAQGAIGFTPADVAKENREVYSLYVDVSDQVNERLLVDGAVRLEHYSDFGDEVTGKASFYYQLANGYGLRGAASNSLRAPALSQIGFSDRSTNFGDNRTLVNTVTLQVINPIAQALGASALKPETSRNLSVGFTAQPLPRTSFSLDAFNIEVDDRITLSDRLFGQALVNFVSQQPGGQGIESVRFFTNAIDTRTRGIDLILTHQTDLLSGNLNVTLGYSFSKTSIERIAETPVQLSALDSSFRLIGVEEINTIEESAPRQKASLLTTWQREQWTLINRIHYFGSVVRVFNFGGGFEPRQRYGAEYSVDFEGVWQLNDAINLRLGVNNALDNYPDLSSADINFFGNLPHDVLSPITDSGRYFYTGMNVRF